MVTIYDRKGMSNTAIIFPCLGILGISQDDLVRATGYTSWIIVNWKRNGSSSSRSSYVTLVFGPQSLWAVSELHSLIEGQTLGSLDTKFKKLYITNNYAQVKFFVVTFMNYISSLT